MFYLIALHHSDEHHVLHQLLPPERRSRLWILTQTMKTRTLSHIWIPAIWNKVHSQNAVQRHVLSAKFYATSVSFISFLCHEAASCQLLINDYFIPFYSTIMVNKDDDIQFRKCRIIVCSLLYCVIIVLFYVVRSVSYIYRHGTTLCPKKRHPFYFLNNSVKN